MNNMNPLMRDKQQIYFKRLKNELDNRKLKGELVSARKQFLQNQTVSNYTSEYKRLNSIYDKSSTGVLTKQKMKDRMKELLDMGASAVDTLD